MHNVHINGGGKFSAMDFDALAKVIREFDSIDLLAYAIENEFDPPDGVETVDDLTKFLNKVLSIID